MSTPTGFKRILLKVSGEVLMGPGSFGIDMPTVKRIAGEIAEAQRHGHEIGLVIGGGNIFRGVAGAAKGLDRADADHMGMLATVMNALALQGAIASEGADARVSAIPMPTVCEPFVRQRAMRHLSKGRVVIFAAGTGSPFFTTDTTAALRAAETKCEALLKGTSVDGIYAADPKTDPSAERFDRLTYDEVLARNLMVMDAAAIALARNNAIPVIVFSIRTEGALLAVLEAEADRRWLRREGTPAPPPGRNEAAMTKPTSLDFKDVERRMHGAVEVLRHEFAGLRTGRASANLLEPITVEAYGSQMPLSQVGTISVPESRMLAVQVWDRALVSAVDKAIRASNLGLNPIVDGQLVRVPIPELTEERRKELTKVAHQYAEKARIAVRNVRRDGMEMLKRLEKDGHISEDQHHEQGDRVQKMTDNTISEIDKTLAHKDADIMQV